MFLFFLIRLILIFGNEVNTREERQESKKLFELSLEDVEENNINHDGCWGFLYEFVFPVMALVILIYCMISEKVSDWWKRIWEKIKNK
jgi:hypothetical protein